VLLPAVSSHRDSHSTATQPGLANDCVDELVESVQPIPWLEQEERPELFPEGFPETPDCRQGKGRCFSGPGLCSLKEIVLLNNRGNGLLVTGGWRGTSTVANGLFEKGVQRKNAKTHYCSRNHMERRS